MRRLYADREEKRVTRGSDISGQDGEQEQLDVNYPNQRSLLDDRPLRGARFLPVPRRRLRLRLALRMPGRHPPHATLANRLRDQLSIGRDDPRRHSPRLLSRFRLERAQCASQRCPIGSSGKRPIPYARDAWLDGGRRDAPCVGAATHSVGSRGVAKETRKIGGENATRCFPPLWCHHSHAFSAVMFISDARFNVAEAQGKPRAEDLACGKELQELCSGLATLAFGNQWPGTKIPNCLAREKAKLSKRCAARAANIVKSCGADVRRRCAGNVTGQGNILACLTMARGVVSAGCNAALDAAYLR